MLVLVLDEELLLLLLSLGRFFRLLLFLVVRGLLLFGLIFIVLFVGLLLLLRLLVRFLWVQLLLDVAQGAADGRLPVLGGLDAFGILRVLGHGDAAAVELDLAARVERLVGDGLSLLLHGSEVIRVSRVFNSGLILQLSDLLGQADLLSLVLLDLVFGLLQ